jgi:hypothetical protein
MILNFNAVRVRALGSGSLRLSLLGLSEVKTKTLLPLTLSTSSDKELTRIANFNGERAQLEIRTTGINEQFKISRITVFVKPIFTSYPS